MRSIVEKLMLCSTPFNYIAFCCYSPFLCANTKSYFFPRPIFSDTFFSAFLSMLIVTCQIVWKCSDVNSLVMLQFNFDDFQLTWSISWCCGFTQKKKTFYYQYWKKKIPYRFQYMDFISQHPWGSIKSLQFIRKYLLDKSFSNPYFEIALPHFTDIIAWAHRLKKKTPHIWAWKPTNYWKF